MQTILGSGGAIGNELARALRAYTDQVRLVSRKPRKVNPDDEIMAADLLHLESARQAVKGSDVVYLTVGMAYRANVWETDWPQLMWNVIRACKEFRARLVFFDNVYMYDPDYLANMTEETPVNPCSKKGKVRTEIQNMIMSEIQKGALTALIARSADFYGPGSYATSILSEMVIKPLRAGKKAMWMGPLNKKHSFTFVPDAAKATALLGNSSDSWNQLWHLPTAANPYTGKEWIEMVARELGRKPTGFSIPRWMVRISGIVVPLMRELEEMMYQYDRDYVFSSRKFESHFGIYPTPYAEGIRETVLGPGATG